MTKNIIFGKKSKLTDSLVKKIKNAQVISSTNINLKKIKLRSKDKTNYIFNNFYPSFKLNNLNFLEYQKFVELSIQRLIQILSNLNSRNINKIIYTSSSSVYSLEENLRISEIDKYNRKIYASFKYSAEKIIENFCREKNIDFYIMRLFNTYGDENDSFSFIEKLIKIKKKKLKLRLINNGISLRDFIHLDDVSLIYKKFLNNKYTPGIYDIGTGEGQLIKNLVYHLNLNNYKE